MINKACTKCTIIKPLEEFHNSKRNRDGKVAQCKSCCKLRRKKHHELNREKYNKMSLEYYKNNKEAIQVKQKKWNEENKEAQREYKKQWKKDNKERNNQVAARRLKVRRKEDPIYRTKLNVSRRIRIALNSINTAKNKRTMEITGLNPIDLWKHLQDTFEANYGMPREWLSSFECHIDHIIPLITAKTEEDVYKLNHYSNLQILLAEDNLKKSCKIDWELI